MSFSRKVQRTEAKKEYKLFRKQNPQLRAVTFSGFNQLFKLSGKMDSQTFSLPEAHHDHEHHSHDHNDAELIHEMMMDEVVEMNQDEVEFIK